MRLQIFTGHSFRSKRERVWSFQRAPMTWKAAHNKLVSIIVCWYRLTRWAPEPRLPVARIFQNSKARIMNHVLCLLVESIAGRNMFCCEASFDHARFVVEVAPYLWSALNCYSIFFAVIVCCISTMPAMPACPIHSFQGSLRSSTNAHFTVAGPHMDIQWKLLPPIEYWFLPVPRWEQSLGLSLTWTERRPGR